MFVIDFGRLDRKVYCEKKLLVYDDGLKKCVFFSSY